MRSLLRFAMPCLGLLSGLLVHSAAQAVLLNEPVWPAPYADTPLPGTSSLARPELEGLVLEDDLVPFAVGGLTGTVQNRVVREDASGTLDFYWKVNVDPVPLLGGASVVALRVGGFGAEHLHDADWRSDGLGSVGPDTARLFNTVTSPQGDINFLFQPGGLLPGSESRFILLHTQARDYARAAQYDLLNDPGGMSELYSTFAPVPEPGALVLAVVGCLLVLSRRVSSRRAGWN